MRGRGTVRLLSQVVLLLAALPWLSHTAKAQVAASAHRPLFLSGYATASGAEPELRAGHALGGSGGIILERSPLFALDCRGVILAARVPLHTFAAEAGPRIAHSYRRLRPYGEVLAGIGHTEYLVPRGSSLPGKGFGFTWTVVGGVDLRLKYHLEWRVAEYSYSQIYAGAGASPTILNTGVVYRF